MEGISTHLDIHDVKCSDSSSHNSLRPVRLRTTPYYLKDYATVATKGPHPHFPSEPKTLREALKDPCWIAAMEEELAALNTNDTWDLVPRPLSINIVGSKWIYPIKTKEDGTIDPSRLVWLQGDSLKFLELIMMKPSVQ